MYQRETLKPTKYNTHSLRLFGHKVLNSISLWLIQTNNISLLCGVQRQKVTANGQGGNFSSLTLESSPLQFLPKNNVHPFSFRAAEDTRNPVHKRSLLICSKTNLMFKFNLKQIFQPHKVTFETCSLVVGNLFPARKKAPLALVW